MSHSPFLMAVYTVPFIVPENPKEHVLVRIPTLPAGRTATNSLCLTSTQLHAELNVPEILVASLADHIPCFQAALVFQTSVCTFVARCWPEISQDTALGPSSLSTLVSSSYALTLYICASLLRSSTLSLLNHLHLYLPCRLATLAIVSPVEKVVHPRRRSSHPSVRPLVTLQLRCSSALFGAALSNVATSSTAPTPLSGGQHTETFTKVSVFVSCSYALSMEPHTPACADTLNSHPSFT
jgi:hypothetical protein